MDLPTLTVIVTNLNGGKEPLGFLASIAASGYPQHRTQTIVVDSGSSDGSPGRITERFPEVTLIRLPDPRGLPYALNRGLARSTGDYVFIGNDDLTVDPGSLGMLVDALEREPSIGLASGTVFLKYPKPGEEDVAYTDYTFRTATGRIAGHRRREPADVTWLQSCALLVRRSVVERIGGFDEGFHPIYFDDLDYCVRAARAGFRLRTVPQASFRHGASQTLGRNLSKKTNAWYRNKVRYLLKQAPLPIAVLALAVQAITSPLLLSPRRPASLLLQSGGFGAFWRGLAWNLAHLSATLAARRRLKEPLA